MPDAKRRGGRPRLASTARRSVRVLARLTPAEGEQLRALAEARGESLSDVLVAGVYRLRRKPTPAARAAERAELLRALAPIASNLNQALRVLHVAAQRGELSLSRALGAVSKIEGAAARLVPLLAKARLR